MTTALATAAAAAIWMASGQLAHQPELPVVAAESPREVPPPPTVPAPKQRIVMADGTERFGRVVGPVEGGIEIENELGARDVLPLTLVARIEPIEVLAVEPRKVELAPSAESIARHLTLTYDVRALEEQKRSLSYGDKATMLAIGAVTTALGLLAFDGERRTAVAGVGIVEAVAGGVWLGATTYRGWRIDQELEQKREELKQAPGSWR